MRSFQQELVCEQISRLGVSPGSYTQTGAYAAYALTG